MPLKWRLWQPSARLLCSRVGNTGGGHLRGYQPEETSVDRSLVWFATTATRFHHGQTRARVPYSCPTRRAPIPRASLAGGISSRRLRFDGRSMARIFDHLRGSTPPSCGLRGERSSQGNAQAAIS